ncbi:MAG TPA: hypothetical protein VF654_18605, partial [Pyrinomonadaceae bacterium]
MSSTHGFKGNVAKLMKELNALRTNPLRPRDVSLREHLAEQYQVTPDHMFSELGVDPHFTRVVDLQQDEDKKWLIPEAVRQGIQFGMGISRQQAVEMARRAIVSQSSPILSEANGGARYISPEVWLDPIMSGAVQAAYWSDLIVKDEPVASDSVNIPNIKLSDASPEETSEGATAEVGTVSHGHKKVEIKKRKRALEITDESVLFNSLSLLSIFFVDYGRVLGLLLNGDAVNVIVNGDVAGGSEASAVIGVSDTTKGFQFRDFL